MKALLSDPAPALDELRRVYGRLSSWVSVGCALRWSVTRRSCGRCSPWVPTPTAGGIATTSWVSAPSSETVR